MAKLYDELGLGENDGLFFAAGKAKDVVKLAGAARTRVGEQLELIEQGRVTRDEEPGTSAVVNEMIQHGISSRSLQHVLALARTHAFMAGRDYVLPWDVKAIAVEALQHRIVRTIRAETQGVSGGEIITELLKGVSLYELY